MMKRIAGSLTYPGQCAARNSLGIRCQRRSGHSLLHEAHHALTDLSYLWMVTFK